jgi:RNA polymerase sigma-70 factor (ECF subfamily)
LPKLGEGVGLSDWPVSGVQTRRRAHHGYACPEDVFEHEYERLVEALTIAAGEREVAADAVQEAFVRLVRNWDRLRDYEDPAGWVRRVALNRICDHRRSIWRQARLLFKIEEQQRAPKGVATTDDRLRARLEALPLKQRTALGLYYMDHLTTREVADVMRVSEGTVKQHLHRARQTLREALKGADNG